MPKLATLRKNIDRIDDMLLKAIKERVKVAADIKELKYRQGQKKIDVKRERDIRKKIRKFCIENNLNAGKILRMFEELFELTRGRREK